MFTDRDFYRSVLAGALDRFDVEKLAALLDVPPPEVAGWALGRTRPPAPLILRVIDLLWPPDRVEADPQAPN